MEKTAKMKSAGNLQKLVTVSMGHFINDFYMELVPPILFIFASTLSFGLTEQGFIAFIIISCGSFAQPIIGYFVDKRGKLWLLIFSVIWISFWMSISGLISNYYLLAIILGLGALASALYHPLGSAAVIMLGNKTKGRSLAIFMTIGGLAASFSPLVSIPIVTKYGLSKLAYLMFPGLIIAGLMYMSGVHNMELEYKEVNKKKQGIKFDFYSLKWVSALVFIATNRILLLRFLITFGIQLLLLKNIDLKIASIVLSLYLLLNSAGTIMGGYLSDIIGSKKVIIIFNILATICVMIIVLSSNTIPIVTAFTLLGFSLSGSNTANIILTQNLIPQNLNMATGLIMGLAGGMGGLGILLFAKFADNYGLLFALGILLIPLILVNVLTIILPKQCEKKELAINSTVA